MRVSIMCMCVPQCVDVSSEVRVSRVLEFFSVANCIKLFYSSITVVAVSAHRFERIYLNTT